VSAQPPSDQPKRARPLSSRQWTCLRVIAEGALYIKDGSVMRTVESLERRGLVELGGYHTSWRLTENGRLALDEEEADAR
jgi:Mn-dependent DtxR family transcriptional regulator